MHRVVLVLLIASMSRAVDLPCEFTFDHDNGYSCRVANFTNLIHHTHVTRVVGDHLYRTDRNYRNRSIESVSRVVFWNASIHYLPGNLTHLFPNMKTLVVKKCAMQSLSRTSELNGMRKIYFGFNEITRIPVHYFWGFCRLVTLSLFGNKISKIPKFAFRDLISLERLSLKGNLLEELDASLFDNCTNLVYVDLDNNSLKIIDGRLFSNRSKLTRVYLRNNKIKSIGIDFLSTLPKLEFALFQGNPCINESFPETPTDDQNPLEYIQTLFQENCSPPLEITTTTRRPSTTAPRKKPKHQRQRVYYFENCNWHTPKNHRYFRR